MFSHRLRSPATALTVALVSLGMSTWSIACNRSDRSDQPEPALQQAAPVEGATPARAPAQAEVTPAQPAAPAIVPVSAAREPNAPAPRRESAAAELSVKRLVVTHAIENREPVAAAELSIGDGRAVFAFVELANPNAEEQKISVTFENGARSVGHVELSVPGNSRRWRTWAKTRNIREAGDRQAVVRNANGQELSRTPFSIK